MQMKLSQVKLINPLMLSELMSVGIFLPQLGYSGNANRKRVLLPLCLISEMFSFILQDVRQIELLKELMDLQKDMVVFLLSMLEGKIFNVFCCFV